MDVQRFRTKSIGIQLSFVGFVAKCVALIGKGEKDEGVRVCDISFQHFHSEHVTLLLLIKVCDFARLWSSFQLVPFEAVVLFMAGEHVDAISRMDDLITDGASLRADPALSIVQAREICPYVR